MGSYGVPEEQARFLVDHLHAGRAGEFDVVDPALGRRPRREPPPLRAADRRSEVGR